MEDRLVRLEVYADENMKDLTDRMESMEALQKDITDPQLESIEDRMKRIEEAIKEVPRGLIAHWDEVETKMTTWHSEEKERKEAVRAIWKKLETIQENMKFEDLEEAVDMKQKFSHDLKELYDEIKKVEEIVSK